MVRSVANEGKVLREQRRHVWDEHGFSHSAAHGINLLVFKLYPHYLRQSRKRTSYLINGQRAQTRTMEIPQPAHGQDGL